MMKYLLLILTMICIAPLLQADTVILKNGKQYEGIIYSPRDATVIKIMQANQMPVYINAEQSQSTTYSSIDNREDKTQLAIAQDALRVQEREYLLLKERYNALLVKSQALEEELAALKSGTPTDDTSSSLKPFITLIDHAVKYSPTELSISGTIKNTGTTTATTAKLLIMIFDEDGEDIDSYYYDALDGDKTLKVGAEIPFTFTKTLDKKTIDRITSHNVIPTNEN